MVTSRTSRRRNGLTGYIGNIVDDTKDFLDDLLDRGRDAEREVRDTAQKFVRDDEDIPALKEELDRLSKRLERLDRNEVTARSGSKEAK
ncbi:hypothetical protein [Amycolatopsis sp. cmx-11-51]|uniref:hypothetical protein n=1 Tax=unclassified Amycolatopsis TaxID=2618356 RepID=UPI0039E3EEC2